MAAFTKLFAKKKKEKPAEYTASASGQQMLNYAVYHMKPPEKIVCVIFSFLIGALIGLVFYSGIGKDEFGNNTAVTYISNAIVAVVCGGVGLYFIPPAWQNLRLSRRRKELQLQFRELMDSLASSLGSGKNVMDSFLSAHTDLNVQFAPKSYIMLEVDNIIKGMQNNIPVEALLKDFGQRSGLGDISDFGSVFDVCYRKGGNLKEVVRRTYDVISDKMAITQEIETKVTANKTEAMVMAVMPIGIVAMLKFSGSDFGNAFVSPSGLAATTVAVVIFIAAILLARKILHIEV